MQPSHNGNGNRRRNQKKKPVVNFKKRVKTANTEFKEESGFQEEDRNMDEIRFHNDKDYEDEYEDTFEQERVYEPEKQTQGIQNIVPYMGTRGDLPEGQHLEFSNSGYVMYHRAQTEWPCLSVDFILPGISNLQNLFNVQMLENFDYPLELYAVGGSQADFSSQNQLYIMKFMDLAKTRFDDDEVADGLELEKDEKVQRDDIEPALISERFQLFAAVNRIRTMGYSPLTALMNQTGQLQIFDITKNIESLKNKTPSNSAKITDSNCTKMLGNHQLSEEGFALNWSSAELGTLGCGTNDGVISIFKPKDESFSEFVKIINIDKAHSASVEDIVFSPIQSHVLASASADNSIKLFDLRDPSSIMTNCISINGHKSDVNVISWNPKNSNLLASGDDDGFFKVFDLRYPTKEPLTDIHFHVDSICSIEWQPHDEWTLAVASIDNRVSLWDLSVENDSEGVSGLMADTGIASEDKIPEQLLFLHQGQEELREVRWHPMYKDVMMSTALDSFNVFQPCLDSFEDIEEEEPDYIKNTHSPNDLEFN